MQEENSAARDSAHRDPARNAARTWVRRKQPNKPGELSPVQELAMQRIIGGGSIAEAADAARVDRRTVYRWLHADPHFAAAYAAWQREVIASSRARVLAMTNLALDTVHNAMCQGNVHAAIVVAKAAGAMDAPNPGTTDPAYFRHRQKRRDRARKETIESAKRRDWLKRHKNSPYRAAHCEHMIDGYIRDRRDALRHETPAQRTQRLADQAKRHRNYDPLMLRLLATMDAELAAPAPAPAGDAPAEPVAAGEAAPKHTNCATKSQAADPPAPAAPTPAPAPDAPAPSASATPSVASPAPPAEPAAFPGDRDASAKSADPARSPTRRRPPPVIGSAYHEPDEIDDDPTWVNLT